MDPEGLLSRSVVILWGCQEAIYGSIGSTTLSILLRINLLLEVSTTFRLERMGSYKFMLTLERFR